MARTTITHSSLTAFSYDLDRQAKDAAKQVVTALDDYIHSDDPLPRHMTHAFRQVTSLSSDARTIRVLADRYLFDSSRPMGEDDEVANAI